MYRNDLLKFYAILSFLSLKRDERIWVVNFITKGMEEFMKEKGNEKKKLTPKLLFCMFYIDYFFCNIMLRILKKSEIDFN